MAMYAKVRRMRYRDGLSISEIARRTSLSRNTVKTWLREPVRSEMTYRRPGGPCKLDAHAEWLVQALEADARRPRKERRTALRLMGQLRERGYSGGYSQVTAFIRSWRARAGAVTARSGFVPLRFDWGEAFQFDWSEESLLIGGIWRNKIQLAHMKLCASRAFWLVAYPSQGHEMLFDAHTRCLTGLGGVARRGIYDNMKTAVDRVPGRGKARIVNARFAAMTAHYLFDPDFCNVASGWEKGRVEKGVQDTRRRIWQLAAEHSFANFGELNVWLGQRCIEARNAPHPDISGMSIQEAWEQEQTQLMPVPTPFDGYVESPARVSSTSLVSIARNRYSVPCAHAGHRVSVRLYPERVVIVADQQIVAEHPRASDRDHVVYDWRHYVPLIERKPGALRNGAPFADLPAPLQRLSRALLRRDGGDRVMAQVLSAVPAHGLEAVLVAVDLVLESGRPSAEHVLNVLARLKEGKPPPTVDTDLTVSEAPVADPQRYDSLRTEVSHG
ncbi:IS21 family transposase [Polycyclovorans algicola]|uniref:IS21 family transposase n=1 Tax=Polycyclovorans algicola TaxID=616992 RepID=UPI0004A6AF02|nr:IS21 family transposase [Polycyclovorans algicola]